MRIISIGEILWDVVGNQEHLGGAPLNFAAHSRKLGHDVCMVSGIGCDRRGDAALERMNRMDLSTRFVSRVAEPQTGIATVVLDKAGQPSFRINRPAAYDFLSFTDEDLACLFSPKADAVYFGTLLQMSLQARKVTNKILDANSGARRFYDINLRPSNYEPELVRQLISLATIVKLNEEEVGVVDRICGQNHGTLQDICWALMAKFSLEAVCVTRGPKGCAVLIGDDFVEADGYAVPVVDAVGAGDAFAAAFLHGLWSHWPGTQIADFANRVGAFVTSRPGAIPDWTIDEICKIAFDPPTAKMAGKQR